ncbi:MAG: hypothetical protein IPP82_05080 [Xanthomonadales bacterium]|nr:hypothetical protein [Xanthomonadales bacterium]
MNRSFILGLLLLLFAAHGHAADRYSGAAALAPLTTVTSDDTRFALTAAMKPAVALPKTSADERYSVLAALAAPKALATSCGAGDIIFKNGFDS